MSYEYTPQLPADLLPTVYDSDNVTAHRVATRPLQDSIACSISLGESLDGKAKLEHGSNYTRIAADSIGPQLYDSRQHATPVDIIAKRSKDTGLKQELSENNTQKRPEWMTCPPDSLDNNTRVQNRTFSQKTADPLQFDPSWVSTPNDKNLSTRNSDRKNKLEQQFSSDIEEDKKKQDIVDEYNRVNRPKTLMELHQEKLKTKGNKSSRSSKRRTGSDESDSQASHWKDRRFNRERDLAVNWVDSKRNNKVLEQTQYLSSKYGHGQRGSYL
ncbi:hypothetical protein BB561_004900 [Smittium simulii]|uniref:DUF3752 domain-containing protein n=1 Tax=Smittium simulii TaxID=133385 RepID=A0A2T9YDI8_9FUNG|nr:hypothetical protein BB561_004900 [Smittium simulii]